MPDHVGDVILPQGLPEPIRHLRRHHRVTPLIRRLGEHLDDDRTDGAGPGGSQLDPAGGHDVGTDQMSGLSLGTLVGGRGHPESRRVRRGVEVRADDSGIPGGRQPLAERRDPVRAQLLIAGDPEARPAGLERMLLSAGFEVAEGLADAGGLQDGAGPEVVLLTAGSEAAAVLDLATIRSLVPSGIPVVVTLAGAGAEAVVRLLEEGAADVLPAPVDLEELRVRLTNRVRASWEMVGAIRVTNQVSQLLEAYQEISVAVRPEEALQLLVHRLGEVLRLSHAVCLYWTPSQSQGRLVARHDDPRVRDVLVDLERYPEATEAIRSAETVFVPDLTRHPLFLHERARMIRDGAAEARSALAVPVVRQGRPIGAIVLRSGRHEVLRREQVQFAERLVQGTSRILETQERRAALGRRLHGSGGDLRDPLTGCDGLDALDRRLEEELDRARRYGLSFCLVLVDVSGLGGINQRYGQAAGDRVLAELGTILQREIRGPDFVARYGGDEFAVVLPETSADGARRTIERVRDRLARERGDQLPQGDAPELTAGIAAWPHDGVVQTADLFALAEAELERAKLGARS